MENYNFKKIEKKWQKIWEKKKLFQAKDFSSKPKKYILVEFPYPSGDGLHVGHCRPYIALDIVARKKRMQGYNILFPMGWDAFGLPTENFAVKTGIHPAIVTKKNTRNFKQQQKKIGLSFDWTREINTTDSGYYKWTQWIFIQLFKKGLAYKSKMPINWCPFCKIGLANEEVVDGKCERCGKQIIRKEKEQWMLRITDYAERLIQGLDKVDYPERVKTLERDWIGRSDGCTILFKLKRQNVNIKVFTTRIDTIPGATYLVLAPEHPILENLKPNIENWAEVEKYIKQTEGKLERERISGTQEKTGTELRGIKAINPITKKEIPIFIADYVLKDYGTGAIMAVPAHDERDFDFAKRYNLPIQEVVIPDIKEAQEKVLKELKKEGSAEKSIQYKLRDWVFSRQRYWGEPIPMIKCPQCGWQPVSEKNLPVKLPKIKDYQPTESGESPLAKNKKWIKVQCPKCKGKAQRETDVMPNWAGSDWYFLRYCDSRNNKELANPKLLEYWMPVDWYNGGMEHTNLHLLYSRFIYKFLWDINVIPKSIGDEPYKKRTSHGVILAQGGVKMSKSRGNVITPDEIISRFGADALRVYEMFMGPFSQSIAWDSKGLNGVKRFLDRVWALKDKVNQDTAIKNQKLKKIVHQTIKKVSEDIEHLKFNTAISCLMILLNEVEKEQEISLVDYLLFLVLLSPFAPHLTEELYQGAKKTKSLSISQEKWPDYNQQLVEQEKIILIIQINGKVRNKIEVEKGITEPEAKGIALASPKIKKWLDNKEIKKIIFIKDKLINFVI